MIPLILKYDGRIEAIKQDMRAHLHTRNKLALELPSLSAAQPAYREFREGDIRHSQAGIYKAQQMLGYQPTHQICEGIVEAMDLYVAKQ